MGEMAGNGVNMGEMAGVTGLEPAASGVTGRRSNQLSYTPFAKVQASMPDEGQN